MGAVKAALLNETYPRIEYNNRELAQAAWPDLDPVMVAPAGVHFSGDYPKTNEHHRCATYWRAGYKDNFVRSIAPITYQAWRPVITKKGVLFCAACHHERALGFSDQIERVSLHYRHLDALRFTFAEDDTERRQMSDRIRKHNERQPDGAPLVSYTTFPLERGAVVLHDAPDYLEGDTLPDSRAALFELVKGWIDTPKGKRAAHGLEAWARNGQAIKGDDDTDQNQTAEGKGKGQRPSKFDGYIFGDGWSILRRVLSAHLDQEIPRKGAKFIDELPLDDFRNLLDAAGIDHGLENVTVNTDTLNNICTKRDIEGKSGKETGSQTALPLHDPPEPAPIYL